MIIDMNELGFERSVAAVRALEVELFGRHAWSENLIRGELSAPARTYVFSVDDGPDTDADPRGRTVRGFAGYWYDGDDAEIMDVGVAKASQRRGIAAALMGEIIRRARNQGARRMLLEVAVNNDPALALYRRFGFEPIGLRKRYYQPEGIDAHVMALDLNPRPVGFQPSTGTWTEAPAQADDAHTGSTRTDDNTRTDKEGTAQ
ncbi:ribosomal protein S18-alanine N-acetyltransferase [Bifidobacterium vespertilionis]|uniref:ribosomal protein S18-alanine N-acetyltransferase n=1 Tax=Bifidobacterium vespertilionis TaxID=2562524 RepID=UPI001BDD38D6|nr:ribosomal protein S18-alanine N-acetyltransferase [Bifidobacterium vespertilionis]MBT1178749.1 ribosomal protein S18-alanine N-acetyltransferase [Bifidobacterium vespertilionis]